MWWWNQQATDWKIGNYQLGTREEFRSMCVEAEKYGIKIIVEVLPNQTTQNLNLVSQELQNVTGGQDALYHANGFNNITQLNNRYEGTTGMSGGLPDVNTENKRFQAYYMNYVNDIIACGGDGFRYNEAEKIGVPSDPKDANAQENDFWPIASGKKSVNGISLNNNGNLFIYGDLAQDNNFLESEYAQYMNVTASGYGEKLRSAINSKIFSVGNLSDWGNATSNKMVTMVESQDTYFNQNESNYINSWKTKMCWAVIAARAQGTPVFFSRPDGSEQGNLAGKNVLGAKGDDMFKDPEVVAVNRFRNAMVGQPEYLLNQDGGQVLLIGRGSKGVTIINLGGDKQINIQTKLADSTYTDIVSGSTFKVLNGNLTGTVKAGRIAVLYFDNGQGASYIGSSRPSGSFIKEPLDLTLSAINVKSSNYSINDGIKLPYTNGQKISIGYGCIVDNNVTLTLNAITARGESIKETYTYNNKPVILKEEAVYFKVPSGWRNPTCYVYDDSKSKIKENAPWPGVAMVNNGGNEYCYKIPAGYTKPKVILVSGNKQFPGANQPGHVYTAGKALMFDGKSWTEERITDINPKPVMQEMVLSPYGNHYVGREITIHVKEMIYANQKNHDDFFPYSNEKHYPYFKFEVDSKVISDFSDEGSASWTPTEPGTYEIKLSIMFTDGVTDEVVKNIIVK